MAQLIEAAQDAEYSRSPSVTISGVRIDALELESVVDAIAARAASGASSCYVVTPNAHRVVLFQDDTLFREIYGHAFLVVPDGVSLLWAAKLLGTPLRERINGTDFFEALCARAACLGLRILFLGGRESAAAHAASVLEFPSPRVALLRHILSALRFRRRRSRDREDPCRRAGGASGSHICRPWCAKTGILDAPTRWGAQGTGMSFELVAGVIARAPR